MSQKNAANNASGHYLAYYELHKIPWELPAPVRFKDSDTGAIFELGRGPYNIPHLASPKTKIRAGGATLETKNDNYVLEGGTYFGVAIPVRLPESDRSPVVEPGFEELFRMSDDAARVIGLCLDQRTPLKRVAAYIRENRSDDKPGRTLATWQLSGGAAASICDKSVESVRMALDHALNPEVPPRVLLALRWYDLSKNASTGADRLVSLWVSLEALMGPVKNNRQLVGKTAQHLAGQEYGLCLNPDQIKQALGLEQILSWRNKIMHEGVSPVPWPVVPDDPRQRDWPQILCDIVGEILRHQLSASLTGALRRHIDAGLKMGSG